VTTDAPFSPQQFGKYVLVDKIATGGMAEIFKAKSFSHGGFESLLVIKRILPHIGENQEFVSMFVDEAKISVALQHPNIVRVHDFGKILENYFIAMECVDGKDTRNVLRKLARKRQWLPEKFAAYIVHEVCKGLFYAHTKADVQGRPLGIVHRDISPSNVLVSYEGEVKIADFGIAKAERNAYQTRDGMLKGKFEYMSPEQAAGKDIDSRSDLFSIGIILYEMLTARRLFKTDSEVATLGKVREGEIVAPSTIKADVSPGLEAICMRALERDPAARYASAEQMADDLRELLFPDTADTLRRELKAFLHELFAEEIGEERARLESGSAIAEQMKDRLPVEWDGTSPEVTMTKVTETAVRQIVPMFAAFGFGMLLLFGVALGGLFWYVADQAANQTEAVAAIEKPGTVELTVSPKAKIYVDGVLREENERLTIADLPPGSHVLRFEANGYITQEKPVSIEAGRVVQLDLELNRQRSSSSSSASADRPEVEFRSAPPGATVFVDDVQVGVTPFTWTDGKVGGKYTVRMKLDGYQSREDAIKTLKKGSTKFTLNLTALNRPGMLTVVLDGGGWGDVYVDGVKLPKTAPMRDVQVPPGSHKIRVENSSMGLEYVGTYQFSGGETTVVTVPTN
jgi:serine/threonine protein kinase